MGSPNHSVLRIGDLRVDPTLDEVRRDDLTIKLEPKAMQLLICLAESAGKVAAGNWGVRVETTSNDEIGRLGQAFNRMTGQLVEQRERLVQAERVAAWRELARRLAHELKNPLFPLQITVENMQRARESHPDQFDEVFREGTGTLLRLQQRLGAHSTQGGDTEGRYGRI